MVRPQNNSPPCSSRAAARPLPPALGEAWALKSRPSLVLTPSYIPAQGCNHPKPLVSLD